MIPRSLPRPSRSVLLLLALSLAACTRRDPARPSDSAAAASIAASAPTAAPDAAPTGSAGVTASPEAGAATFTLAGIAAPAPPKAGPLRVEGFPKPIDVGMSDAAQPFGFTRDGERFVYCELEICCADEDNARCTVVDRAGSTTPLGPPDVTPSTPRSTSLLAFAKAEGLVGLSEQKPHAAVPPKPTGTFAFGGEMTIVVAEVPPPADDVPGSGNVKIGARLDGEAEPVFVVFPPRAKICDLAPGVCMEASLNALGPSPSGDELAALVFVRNPSHGSTFVPVRIPATTFAARVFNDTGMRHHAKKAWARSAALFTRAVYADPTEEKFAFNLACALSRLEDGRAEHALRHAAALGGDAVRARAEADADLAWARTQPWFARASRGT